MPDPRRAVPSVDRLLSTPPFAELIGEVPRARLISVLGAVLERVRDELSTGAAPASAEPAAIAERLRAELRAAERQGLRRVINATGVVLHTNLGRAPLADVAVQAMVTAAAGYTNLEYDVDAGERGSRYDHCAPLLRELTGAEDALVVNNNAAAVVLALNTLAAGRDAVVSRGELVEIGGAFRVPEIMGRSGARMVEVGSTNRTHAQDYTAAIGEATGAVLKVHRSNFRVTGFVAEVGLEELVALSGDVPVVNDLGSGLLIDPARLGLPPEPTAAEAVASGAAVVTLSGDKLLGGPQAGILLGRSDVIATMRGNPLCRALRPDKLTLAALEATLTLYRDPDVAIRQIPTLRMLTADAAELHDRAERIRAQLVDLAIEALQDVSVEAGVSTVGGGAYPEVELVTSLVSIGSPAVDVLAARLRGGEPPVVARISNDRLLIDPRTLLPGDDEELVEAIANACR